MIDDMTESEYLQSIDDWGAEEDLRYLREEKLSSEKKKMIRQYNLNKNAEVGCTIPCPVCGNLILKNCYQKVFCSKKKKGKSNCKDKYWNLINPRGVQKYDYRA